MVPGINLRSTLFANVDPAKEQGQNKKVRLEIEINQKKPYSSLCW
jgi:hypothetical protein